MLTSSPNLLAAKGTLPGARFTEPRCKLWFRCTVHLSPQLAGRRFGSARAYHSTLLEPRGLCCFLSTDFDPELKSYWSEFLCTCVDREGWLQGINLDWFHRLRWATRLPITAAGGIRSRAEVVAVARLKMKDAVGMALYRNRPR